MRNAFSKELTRLAENDERITLLVGDIGNKLFDNFKGLHPNRYFNCGVAEANMIGVSAGMAKCGFRPFVYSITPFVTTRCFEQIRVDLCYQNLPVVIIGLGAGFSYPELGPTHHSCEDIGMFRLLPNITIICPSDPIEVKLSLQESLKINSPVYIRLGKKGEPNIHKNEPNFQVGKSITVKNGTDVIILSTGNIMPLAISCSEELQKQNISTRIESYHTIKPLNKEILKEAFTNYKIVISLEEHSVIGGLGSSIAEWLADNFEYNKARFLRFGTEDKFFEEVGSQDYAREKNGLSIQNITSKIISVLKK